MLCRNCGKTIAEGSTFCVSCGTRAVAATVCKHCGEKITPDDVYCPKCGLRTWNQNSTAPKATQTVRQPMQQSYRNLTGKQTVRAYLAAIISAVLTFILRLRLQAEFYTVNAFMDNKYYIGLDEDAKPLLAIIPIAAAIFSFFQINNDTETSQQKKKTAWIWVGVLLALSVFFIWYDVPYELFDF